jgi:protein gp37
VGEVTGIAWTHHTFSAWEGCAKVSAGCKHCYAETRNERFHGGKHWGADAPRLMRSESYWREPLKWARAARAAGERRRVFCSSLADVFEDRPDLEAPRARLFSIIEATPELDWLLLTKRPENMHRLVPLSWRNRWPSHVWAGTTAENMEMLEQRSRWLRLIPARVRFLSCEPLLEALDINSISRLNRNADEHTDGINWVIVGGESGPKARPYNVNWGANIIRQCREAGVPVFHKQVGSAWTDGFGPGPKLRDRAGADPSEWPYDLQVQEVPR